MKLSYDVYNAPSDRQPIIFLHGIGDWRHTWKKVAPEIARITERQAYVFDARNHGSSPRSSEDMDYDVLTQDLVDFMDDLGIESAVLVGHSMGGRTAINFALKHPGRTKALVVEDMTPRNVRSGTGSFVFQIIYAAKEVLKAIPSDKSVPEGKKFLLNFLASFAGDKFIDVEKFKNMDGDFIPITKNGDSFEPTACVEPVLRMLKKDALVQKLPESGLKYQGDALFLYGSKPFFNLGKDTSIPKLFPKAIVKKIDGSSHYIHLDNPEVFIQEVSNFILEGDIQHSKMD